MKVGDYVRTIDGIWKISAIKTGAIQAEKTGYYHHLYNEEIDKSSPNIIDLIKVGDYVNGCRVEENNGLGYFIILQNGKSKWLSFKGLVIKSIVTKEQFKSMEYKV